MYCILVAGMRASGKSTIAVRISESLGISHFQLPHWFDFVIFPFRML